MSGFDGIQLFSGIGVSKKWITDTRLVTGPVSVKWFGAIGDGVTDDTQAINDAISSFPTAAFKTPAGTLTAPYGYLYFPTGVYKITSRIVLPAGSHILISGAGRAYQDVNLGSSSGGTILASTATNGILYAPVTNGFGDSSTVVLRDMDFRQDGVLGHSDAAVYLPGVMSGGCYNIGVINDYNYSGVMSQDGFGLHSDNGSLGNTFFLRDIDVGSFGANGRFNVVIGSNHMVVENLHINGMSGVVNGINFTSIGNRCDIGSIHFFNIGDGTGNIKLLYFNAQSSTKIRENVVIRDISIEDIVPGPTQTNGFILRADTKIFLDIGRMSGDRDTPSIFAGARDWVSLGFSGGSKLTYSKPGFQITTPTLPAGTGIGNKVINGHPKPVRIYQANSAVGVHIIDTSGTDIALPSPPSEFVLDPGCSVYYAGTVPESWVWYGM